jgi:hypothetical protein
LQLAASLISIDTTANRREPLTVRSRFLFPMMQCRDRSFYLTASAMESVPCPAESPLDNFLGYNLKRAIAVDGRTSTYPRYFDPAPDF